MASEPSNNAAETDTADHLFDRLRDLSEAEQEQALREMDCDADVKQRVRAWLRHDDQEPTNIPNQRTEPSPSDTPVPPLQCPSCGKKTLCVSDDSSGLICRSCRQQFAPKPDPERELAKVSTFKIIGFLGQGGFGRVWFAKDAITGKYVALKIPKETTNPRRAEDFLGETRRAYEFLKDQSTANRIPQLVNAGVDNGIPYIAFEFVNAKPLAESLRNREQRKLRRSVEIVEQIADALQIAHNHDIVHRDVKPGNVLVEKMSDKRERVYLTDFGISKDLSQLDGHGTQGNEFRGSFQYASPEHVHGGVEKRSDVFSLGIILFELLSGKHPFPAPTPIQQAMMIADVHRDAPRLREVKEGVDPKLEEICAKCLKKKPSERYSSAGELRDALNRFLSPNHEQDRPETQDDSDPGSDFDHEPPGTDRDTSRPTRMHWTLWLLAFPLLAVTSVLITIFVINPQQFAWDAPERTDTGGPADVETPPQPTPVESGPVEPAVVFEVSDSASLAELKKLDDKTAAIETVIVKERSVDKELIRALEAVPRLKRIEIRNCAMSQESAGLLSRLKHQSFLRLHIVDDGSGYSPGTASPEIIALGLMQPFMRVQDGAAHYECVLIEAASADPTVAPYRRAYFRGQALSHVMVRDELKKLERVDALNLINLRAGMLTIVNDHPDLSFLSVKLGDIDDQTMRAWSFPSELKEFVLQGSEVTDEALSSWELPSTLERLELRENARLTGSFLASVSDWPVYELRLMQKISSDEMVNLDQLSKMSRLKHLSIVYIDDEAVPHLKVLKQLEKIWLNRGEFEPGPWKELETALGERIQQ